MPRYRSNLTIQTDHGIKTIQPWAHPVVEPTDRAGNMARVCHSNTLITMLDEDEVRRFITRVCWQPSRRCPSWTHNECWGARQYRAGLAPPLSCVGCQLRAVLMEATGDDLRLVPVRERGPWPVAFAVVFSVFPFLWLHFQASGSAVRAERARADAEHAGRVRAERELAAFRRQKQAATTWKR